MQNPDKFCLVAPVDPLKWTKSYIILADFPESGRKNIFISPITKIFIKGFLPNILKLSEDLQSFFSNIFQESVTFL